MEPPANWSRLRSSLKLLQVAETRFAEPQIAKRAWARASILAPDPEGLISIPPCLDEFAAFVLLLAGRAAIGPAGLLSGFERARGLLCARPDPQLSPLSLSLFQPFPAVNSLSAGFRNVILLGLSSFHLLASGALFLRTVNRFLRLSAGLFAALVG